MIPFGEVVELLFLGVLRPEKNFCDFKRLGSSKISLPWVLLTNTYENKVNAQFLPAKVWRSLSMLGCVVYSVKSVELSPLVGTPVFHEIFSQRKAWFESDLWSILKTIAQSYREEKEDCKHPLRNLGGSLKWKRRKKNHEARFIVCRVKLAFQTALIFKSIERTTSDFLYSSMGNSRSETYKSAVCSCKRARV